MVIASQEQNAVAITVTAQEAVQFRFLPKFSHYSHFRTHLLRNHLGYHVSGVNIDGADGHDLLPITRGKLPDQHGDEGVQLRHLLPVVLLQGIVIALLQTSKRHADIRCPPDLSAGQRHLNEK